MCTVGIFSDILVNNPFNKTFIAKYFDTQGAKLYGPEVIAKRSTMQLLEKSLIIYTFIMDREKSSVVYGGGGPKPSPPRRFTRA